MFGKICLAVLLDRRRPTGSSPSYWIVAVVLNTASCIKPCQTVYLHESLRASLDHGLIRHK